MTATPRYYPAEDAPRTTKKVVAKVQNVSLRHAAEQVLMRSMRNSWELMVWKAPPDVVALCIER